MQFTTWLRPHEPLLLGMLLLLVCAGAARASDTYSAGQLSIPSVGIGSATYSNLVVTPDIILSVMGGAPRGGEDSYDPASKELSIASVVVGSATYTNVLITVGSLVSIGSVSGVDTYSGGELHIPSVQVGGAIYNDVVVTVGGIIDAGGGMPMNVRDVYDLSTGRLTIAAIQLGSTVYTNPVITIGTIVTVGSTGIVESILHSFSGNGGTSHSMDGATPYYAGLIRGSDGSFYGTTRYGGAYDEGVVFRINAAGAESVIYSFGTGGETDGAFPYGGLIQDSDGNIYGTTTTGGANNAGSVFKITAAGIESVFYSFGAGGSAGGTYPYAGLIQADDGNFYATTNSGGAYGLGAVIRITPAGAGSVVYSFGAGGSKDGAAPVARLVQASDGNFYGTTSLGGANNSGIVFRLTAGGVETVLHSFGGTGGVSGGIDGGGPFAGLIQGLDGNLYGATSGGGAFDSGTIFRITMSGAESVLYSFGAGGSADAAEPSASLIQGSDGNFYGTSVGGGAQNQGTVFRVTAAGAESVLYSFMGTGGASGLDGAGPSAGLIQDGDGNAYGTTRYGGAYGQGTVFVVTNAVPGT